MPRIEVATPGVAAGHHAWVNTRDLPHAAAGTSAAAPAARHVRGRAAEDLAAAHLAARGLVVLLRRFRCRAGELDLVCRDGPVLAIVEVRSRARADFGGAAASVNALKRRRILRTTAYLLLRHAAWRALPIRFDVVAIDGAAVTSARLTWIQDAFRG
jgi:putative endonuclease